MIIINVVNEAVVGSINGKEYSFPYKEETYNSLNALATTVPQNMEEAKALVADAWAIVNKAISEGASLNSVHPNLHEDGKGQVFFKSDNGVVSRVPMPKAFVEKLYECVDKSLSVDPLIKLWIRTLRNPNVRNSQQATDFAERLCGYVMQTFVSPVLRKQYLEEGYSEEVAGELATVPQIPITMEGLMVTKKVVNPLDDMRRMKYVFDENGEVKRVLRDNVKRELDPDTGDVTETEDFSAEDHFFEPAIMGKSGDAFKCGDKLGHIIKVGQEMALEDWSQVNCDNSRTCVKGLHCGNQDYINGYETEGSVTLNCFVDPAEIGAIPNCQGIIRVKSLFPYSIKNREDENRNFYHSSHYAAQKDQEWAIAKQEIIDKFNKETAEIADAATAEAAELNEL